MKVETIEKLKESYDKYADIREKSEIQPWKENIREDYLKLLKQEGRNSILDLGAGTGRDSKFFKDKGLNVMAVDFSREMVKLCKEKDVEAMELDFFNLHKLNKKFDAVWSLNSLLHIGKKEIPSVMQEIKNILKPDGIFFLGVYGGENFEGIWEEDFYSPHRFFSFYTNKDILEVAERYFQLLSFKIVETGRKYNFQALTLRNI